MTVKELISSFQDLISDHKIFIEDEKRFFVIPKKLQEDFHSWNSARKKEFLIKNQVDFLFPLISKNVFTSKVEELQRLGQQIIDEAKNLKDAINTLQRPSYDFPRIKKIMKQQFYDSGKDEFDRNDLLTEMAKDLQSQGDERTEKHLIKNILPERLSNVISDLESGLINDPEINLDTITTKGRYKTILRLVLSGGKRIRNRFTPN